MGIYYFAVDYSNRQQIWPPDKFDVKSPGIYHPHNPFPNMVSMMNQRGSHFDIINDVSSIEEHEFEDVTNQVYKELKKEWPGYDWDLAEWKDDLQNRKECLDNCSYLIDRATHSAHEFIEDEIDQEMVLSKLGFIKCFLNS